MKNDKAPDLEIVLANVREVTKRGKEILTPLMPFEDTHLQATLVHDLYAAGILWKTIKDRYHIAKRNSKKAIMAM